MTYLVSKIDNNTYKDSDGKVYKQIPDYEDYFIDSNGTVYSAKYGKWRQLKTHLNENGYRRVTLRQNGKTVVRRIARLCASAFIPTTNDCRNVLHIDGNKLNDNYNNLKWS